MPTTVAADDCIDSLDFCACIPWLNHSTGADHRSRAFQITPLVALSLSVSLSHNNRSKIHPCRCLLLLRLFHVCADLKLLISHCLDFATVPVLRVHCGVACGLMRRLAGAWMQAVASWLCRASAAELRRVPVRAHAGGGVCRQQDPE